MGRTLRIALLVWIGAVALALAHGMFVGGGIARPLLLWDLRHNGEVDFSIFFLMALVLIGLPSLPFAFVARRRKPPAAPLAQRAQVMIFGVAFAVFAVTGACAAFSLLSRPKQTDPIVRIDVAMAGPVVPDSRAVLVGSPRPQSAVSYQEVITGKTSGTHRYPHELMPFTAADWVPGQPVRFVLDLMGRGYPEVMRRNSAQEWTTRPGFVLHGQLDDFERHALRERGVVLADDVMLYTTGRMTRASGLIAFATICGIVAVVCLICVFVTLRFPPRVAATRASPD